MKKRLQKLILPAMYALTFLPIVSVLLSYIVPEYSVWQGAILMGGFCLWGWILGAFLPEKVHGVWHILLAIPLPVALAFLVIARGVIPWWLAVLLCVVELIEVILTDRKCCKNIEDVLTTGGVVTCIGMYALAFAIRYVVELAKTREVVFQFDGTDPLLPFGIVALFGGVYLLNWIFTLRMANTRGGTRVPSSIRTSNIVMTTVLAVIMLIAASFNQIREAIGNFFSMIGAWIAKLFDRVIDPATGTMGEEAYESSEMELSGLGETYSTWPESVQRMLRIMAIIVSVAVVCWLLYIIGRKVGRFLHWQWQRFMAWLDAWQKKQKTEEYEDEQEDNFSWERVREDARNTFRRFTKPFRKVRLEQLPDDNARVRQVYAWILERLQKKGNYIPSETPCETGERHLPAGEAEERFIDAYNRARFSEHPVTAEDVQAGRELLRKL